MCKPLDERTNQIVSIWENIIIVFYIKKKNSYSVFYDIKKYIDS